MLPRQRTDYICITATLGTDRPTMQTITWRSRKFGWLDAGCHFIIDEAGLVTPCRPTHLCGVGVRPHNNVAVTVNLSGSAPFTDEQMTALALVVLGLVEIYPDATVVGHSDLPNCRSKAPGFDVTAWFTGLRAVNAL